MNPKTEEWKMHPPEGTQASAATGAMPHRRARAEVFRDAVVWILIGALVLSSITFLVSLNSIISIWFREQWAPIARAVVALLVVLACTSALLRVTRRSAVQPGEHR